ncbi:hypothetical protein PPTG_21456 [Phytophthora nicotianae INRA-310]|uniref:ARS-binding protein 1 N-terminal domain-containing protein n=1 Tax=Phytophthora nicotianae (strain INRA-310) TaxID=761204 RepID=W2R2I2_PHYN3|nr:hypothetical protein PPTG_21456 [Phytophthora nicotianae INRA-310]ETN19451.1 hypothetical protein PPTG_21456 [Phytophthora nicotianae INRA-310]
MRKWMTIDNKRALIRQSREAPGMTQTQLAEWAQQAFRLTKAPARNTVSVLPSHTAGRRRAFLPPFVVLRSMTLLTQTTERKTTPTKK